MLVKIPLHVPGKVFVRKTRKIPSTRHLFEVRGGYAHDVEDTVTIHCNTVPAVRKFSTHP
jgi:hypothetical protein